MPQEPNPNSAVDQAVSRALRENLERIQRTTDELHQAVSDVVAACASSRPTNALPSMLRAQTAAASSPSAAAASSSSSRARVARRARSIAKFRGRHRAPQRRGGRAWIRRRIRRQPPLPGRAGTAPPRQRRRKGFMQDIKMLRPEQVRLGRENKDLCIRLRDDIEKAHREYDRRFKPIMDHPVDYFYRWLVEILAEGDAHALGEYPYASPARQH